VDPFESEIAALLAAEELRRLGLLQDLDMFATFESVESAKQSDAEILRVLERTLRIVFEPIRLFILQMRTI